jgi:hypothetical protein
MRSTLALEVVDTRQESARQSVFLGRSAWLDVRFDVQAEAMGF